MSTPVEISKARRLFNEGAYEEALKILSTLDKKAYLHGSAILVRGDCYYELKMDIEALKEYLLYLKLFPSGRAADYGMFCAGICLKNLGLYKEALQLFERVREISAERQEEIDHAAKRLELQSRALTLIESFTPSS